MNKYSVVIRREIVESFEIEVEAETPEQAEAIALEVTDSDEYQFDWSGADVETTAEARTPEQAAGQIIYPEGEANDTYP
jgi:hypothetical protein